MIYISQYIGKVRSKLDYLICIYIPRLVFYYNLIIFLVGTTLDLAGSRFKKLSFFF